MEKLIVGTVYVESEQSNKWLELQHKFLKKTTTEYKHVTFVNGPMVELKNTEIIGHYQKNEVNNIDGFKQSQNHLIGLNNLLNYFRNNKSDKYLILDLDCFPIMPNWHGVLDAKMKRAVYKPQIAAIVRMENLDIFPHPSAIYINSEGINSPVLNFMPKNITNLLQERVCDVGTSIPLSYCYPLLKSNIYSPHPIFASIYNHLFYHHGCGTRGLLPRSVTSGYFDHFISDFQHNKIKENITNELFKNPEIYIDKLIGQNGII